MSVPIVPGRLKMKNKLLKILSLLLCVVFTFSLCSCSGGSQTQDSGKLNVVCTLFVPYDFVREIAGDKVELTLLLPPGMETHSYEPTPADIKAVGGADLLIRVGENMETWSQKLFDSSTGAKNYLDIASEMGLHLAEHEHHEHGHEHHDHDHEDAADGHIWTNPVYAEGMVKVITEALCRLDEENAEEYRRNCDEYIKKLETLDKEFESIVNSGNRDTVIFSGRYAFKNFAKRYSLNVISALDACSDNSEPGARTVARITDAVREDKIPVIFYEEMTEPRTARVICAETGCDMLLLHSCQNVSRDEFDSGVTYLSLMTQNAENLREALK